MWISISCGGGCLRDTLANHVGRLTNVAMDVSHDFVFLNAGASIWRTGWSRGQHLGIAGLRFEWKNDWKHTLACQFVRYRARHERYGLVVPPHGDPVALGPGAVLRVAVPVNARPHQRGRGWGKKGGIETNGLKIYLRKVPRASKKYPLAFPVVLHFSATLEERCWSKCALIRRFSFPLLTLYRVELLPVLERRHPEAPGQAVLHPVPEDDPGLAVEEQFAAHHCVGSLLAGRGTQGCPVNDNGMIEKKWVQGKCSVGRKHVRLQS